MTIFHRSIAVHGSMGWALAVTLIVFGFSPIVGSIAALILGIAIEVLQWAFPALGIPDFWDVIYTGIGGLAGAVAGVAAVSL